MKTRDDKVYIKDIVLSIDYIFDFMKDKTEHDFSSSVLLQDAVIRRFEIIGEAASKISVDTKSNNPDIEWNLMKDMRNKLIHEYFGISTSTIYHTIYTYLPKVKENLLKLT